MFIDARYIYKKKKKRLFLKCLLKVELSMRLKGVRVGSKEPTRRLPRPHMTDYITPALVLPRVAEFDFDLPSRNSSVHALHPESYYRLLSRLSVSPFVSIGNVYEG